MITRDPQAVCTGLTTALWCSETTLVHGPDGTLVGEDELGNRYYENNNNQIGECSLLIRW